MKPLRFIFITCSLWLFSCKQATDERTEELKSYLSSVHSLPLSDSAVYCFIPANQCQNCYIYNGEKLPALLNERLVIISGFPTSNFRNFKHVYYDKKDAMLSLKLLNYGNRLITLRDQRIEAVISVRDFYAQLDSLGAARSLY